jgi:HEAT repeat protein
VAALGSIGDPSARLAVLDALKDRAYVRRRAVVALAAFDGDEVERALSEAIHDRDWQVRDIASSLATNESD